MTYEPTAVCVTCQKTKRTFEFRVYYDADYCIRSRYCKDCETFICKKCNKVKTYHDFYYSKRRNSRIESTCIKCIREQQRQYYYKNLKRKTPMSGRHDTTVETCKKIMEACE